MKIFKTLKGMHTAGKAGMIFLLMGSCEKVEFDPALKHEFTIQSAADGSEYRIEVGLPAGYHPGGEKYPSLYILDGEENFDFVSSQCSEISDMLGVQNVVTISIGYGNDRSLDYTPTEVSAVTGGGPRFLHFIETQLIPAMEGYFSVDTSRGSRTIMGHSYGGLFGAYAFSVNNRLFGNYILLSPSLWFDDLVSLQFEKQYRTENKDRSQLVFLGIGEAENLGRMQAPFEAFYQTLQSQYPHIKLTKNKEENLGHMGSRNPNIVKGLHYYFQNR
ncbi:MAG TPA: alpha/beta hydrolase-fold protein [Saprospiraceae bacterium]|nr:alpha/beta hydrolase-fold protein [Saprospiraceae bacterium]HNT21580.1 alpha/beta hydrolase-fold protein [Saprospiraceae bacterium]